jgi:hypothetical protein
VFDPLTESVPRIERVIVPEPVVVFDGRTVMVGLPVALIVADNLVEPVPVFVCVIEPVGVVDAVPVLLGLTVQVWLELADTVFVDVEEGV